MSTGKRAYRLLQAYVGREWDRIKNWERLDALRELDDPKPKFRHEAPEQIETPERTVVYVTEGTTKEEAARHILGIEKGAEFREIRHAFVKLSRRSDPSNFGQGSAEQKKALDVYKKVDWSYRTLTEGMSASEKRFGSLEID